MLRDEKITPEVKKATAVEMDKVFGLGLADEEKFELPAEIVALLEKRNKVREEKNYQLSDELRKQIEAAGFTVEDSSEGTKIIK